MKRTDSMRQGVGKKAMIPPALFVIGESLLLTFVLEILSRRSFMDACRFVYKSPLLFLYGCSIVSVTLAIAMLFRKKVFSTTLVTVLWLAFGIADCVLLGFRNNYPLTAVDLQMGLEAIMMMPVYFKIWQIVLIFGRGRDCRACGAGDQVAQIPQGGAARRFARVPVRDGFPDLYARAVHPPERRHLAQPEAGSVQLL